jgi:hypothetical protein
MNKAAVSVHLSAGPANCSREAAGVGLSPMTQLEKWLVVGGAVFAGLASLALHGYEMHFPYNPALVEAAYFRAHLEIQLNPEACAGPLADTNLVCDYPYIGHRPYKNLWEFTGPKKGWPVPQTNGDDHAPDEWGALSLWGSVMKFDEAGRLSFNGKEIGTVKLMTPSSRKEGLQPK